MYIGNVGAWLVTVNKDARVIRLSVCSGLFMFKYCNDFFVHRIGSINPHIVKDQRYEPGRPPVSSPYYK